jgi:DNA invertase Pin-like site-specific DNA recombinase
MSTPDTKSDKTAIGYARVSTRDQADNGHSLDAQRSKIEAYATLHDLELSEVIVDEGQSAKSLDRPGMGRLLGLIRRQDVDVVVIAKLDRITRSVRDLGDLVERFQRSGVEFASVADNIDTTTASGRLVLNVMASVSQWEREAIGERTADALAHLRSNGKRISRFAPFGYKQSGSDHWEEEPHEQEAIRLVLQLRDQGMSLRQIGAQLESQGFLNRRGRRLGVSVIRCIIRRAS